MADIYDVQVALAALAQTAIYPNGTSQPSVSNCDVRIYPGWPIPDTLDTDLTARKAHVSIFPTNIARVSTRFQTAFYTTSVNLPTLTLVTASGNQITVGGTVSLPQACMAIVNGVAYSYGVITGDTLNSIATNLAALIPNATAVSNVITIGNNPHSLITKVIVSGTSVREVAREDRMMIVTVWAPTPLIRSQLGGALASTFAATYRVALPDGFMGQLKYSGSRELDLLEKVKCYRRDIHFTFEFATTQTETDYTIGDNIINTTSSY